MDLGKKIELLRKQKGITQEELAYKLQVSRQSVFKWECGESNPTIDNLKKNKQKAILEIQELYSDYVHYERD